MALAQVAQTGGGVGAPSDLTQTDQDCVSSSGTVQTFTNKKLGSGAPTRINIVSINWSDSTLAGTAEITSVTIAGDGATRAARALGDDQNSNSEIWYVPLSSGATGDIVVTSSTAIDGMTIAVYRLVNYTLIDPITFAAGTTTATVSGLQNQYVTLAAASRRVNVSTSLSNMTNGFSDSCGSFLWGVHASKVSSGAGNLTTTISPTSDTPLIAMATWAYGSLTDRQVMNATGSLVDMNSITRQVMMPGTLINET